MPPDICGYIIKILGYIENKNPSKWRKMKNFGKKCFFFFSTKNEQFLSNFFYYFIFTNDVINLFYDDVIEKYFFPTSSKNLVYHLSIVESVAYHSARS